MSSLNEIIHQKHKDNLCFFEPEIKLIERDLQSAQEFVKVFQLDQLDEID